MPTAIRIAALAALGVACLGCQPSEETTIIQQADTGPVAPTLLFVEPAMGSTLGGTDVLLTGVNFRAGATVAFGPAEATGVTVASSSTIFCATPTGTVGLVDVTVTNPGDQIGVRRKAWEYRVPPQIFSVMPPSGTESGGQLLTLRGLDFQPGLVLSIGGTAVTGFTIAPAGDRLDCTTPAGTVGSATIVVTNPDTLDDTATFTYVAAGNDPTIAAVSPSASLPAGGGTITLTGSNFQTSGTTALYFDTTPATNVAASSATALTATIPSGTAGTRVDLTVVNPNGLSVTASSAFGYDTLTTPPTFAGASAAVPTSPWSLRIEWAPAADNVSPAGSITYQVYLATTSGGQSFSQPTVATAPGQVAVTVGGLTAGATYYVVVRATDEMGSQDYNTAEVTATLPSAPTQAWGGMASLTAARQDHAAVLLDDGRVLVVGGAAGPSASAGLASTEVFDPRLGAWTSGPALATGRFMHTASLLPSGDVLVVGGDNGSQLLASTERYQASTATWAGAGTLTGARREHTATLLKSGRVLVAGGLGSGALASAELYVPGNGWTSTGSMGSTRVGHTATLLASGHVLVVGGDDGTGTLRASTELYDPSAGTWTATGSLATARRWHTATALPSGAVLVAGGDASGALAACERWTPATGAWTSVSSLAGARRLHSATLMPSGHVAVVGGDNAGAVNSVELYNAAADAWTAVGTLNTARFRHTATLATAGEILVTGGESAGAAVASVERGSWGTGNWAAGPTMVTPHGYGFTVTRLPDGRALVVSGYTAASPYDQVEVYDPALGGFTAVASVPIDSTKSSGLYYHSANLLPDGRVLVSGGTGGNGRAFVYDPAQDAWTATGSQNATYRYYHTSHMLQNGKVLVVGGLESGTSYSPNCELYDPSTNTWTSTGALNTGRYAHAGTVLADGRVLVAGGYNGSSGGYQSSGEIYGPATGKWVTVSSLPFGRNYLGSILLPSGRVLVMGGYGTNGISFGYRSDAFLYDPVTDAWASAGLASTGGYAFGLSLLPSGRVLKFGGLHGTYVSGAELYDPASNGWTATGSLATGQYQGRGMLLQDGAVLNLGGYASGYSTKTQRFDEGRGASDAWAPRIASINGKSNGPVTLTAASSVTIVGVGLRGLSEAHGGSTLAGAQDRPVVALEGPLGENGRSYYQQGTDSMALLPAAAYAADGSSLTLAMPASGVLRKGFYYLRITVNGIHSAARTVVIP